MWNSHRHTWGSLHKDSQRNVPARNRAQLCPVTCRCTPFWVDAEPHLTLCCCSSPTWTQQCETYCSPRVNREMFWQQHESILMGRYHLLTTHLEQGENAGLTSYTFLRQRSDVFLLDVKFHGNPSALCSYFFLAILPWPRTSEVMDLTWGNF